MVPIEWQDSFRVGEPVIDEQHRGLVDLINALDDDAEVGFVLDQLTLYVAEHFRFEEDLMAQKGSAGLDAHKHQHREFEEWLTASKQAYRTGGTGLGLPITRSLVENFGGRFNLYSELGSGTNAVVNFPPERVVHDA